MLTTSPGSTNPFPISENSNSPTVFKLQKRPTLYSTASETLRKNSERNPRAKDFCQDNAHWNEQMSTAENICRLFHPNVASVTIGKSPTAKGALCQGPLDSKRASTPLNWTLNSKPLWICPLFEDRVCSSHQFFRGICNNNNNKKGSQRRPRRFLAYGSHHACFYLFTKGSGFSLLNSHCLFYYINFSKINNS